MSKIRGCTEGVVLVGCLLLAGCYPHNEENAVKVCKEHRGLSGIVWARNGPPVAMCIDGTSFILAKDRM